MNARKKSYLAAILFSTIIGLSFLFTKITLGYADPLTNLAHRYSVAVIVLLILHKAKLIRIHLSKKDIFSILPLSIFYPMLFFCFQAFALQHISTSEAGIIQALLPISTLMLASVFLKEKTNLFQKLFLIVSVTGVIYIFINRGLTLSQRASYIGFLFMVISVLSNSIYNVLGKYKGKQYEPINLTAVMITVGFLLFNFLSIGSHVINGSLTSYFTPLLHVNYLMAIFYLGFFASIVTVTLSIYAMVHLGASTVSVFSNLSTVLTILSGAVILHEPIYPYHIIGSFLIIAGIIGMNLLREKSR